MKKIKDLYVTENLVVIADRGYIDRHMEDGDVIIYTPNHALNRSYRVLYSQIDAVHKFLGWEV